MLLSSTYAAQILWGPVTASGNLTAVGVQTLSNGVRHSYFAKREVILAVGALKTPQLLELSGVGNPQILVNAGILVASALSAVGEGLQDQINNGLTFASTAKTSYTGQRGYAVYVNATDVFGSGKSRMASDLRNALANYAREVVRSNSDSTSYEQVLSEFQTQYVLLFNKQIPMAKLFSIHLALHWPRNTGGHFRLQGVVFISPAETP